MGAFDWEKLAEGIQEDALSDNKKGGYEEDSRFYKLSRDKNDNGGALIRFVPSSDGVPFVKMIKINADKGANNRFCKDWSPQSIGKPDPFNEQFLKLWKAGRKEEAKKFGRLERYIANIKVIKDPANPENEGKFFLLDMSKTLFGKIKAAIKPSEDEMAIDPDLKPKKVFDPVNGNSFLLKIKKGENNILTYNDSKFAEKVDGIYETEEEALEDINKNAYTLKDWLSEDFYKSYDELKECLDWFMGIEKEENEAEQVDKTEKTNDEVNEVSQNEAEEELLSPEVPEVKETPKKKSSVAPDEDELDALLEEI